MHGGFGGEVELGGRGGYNAGAGVLVPGGDGVAGTGSGGGGEDGTANVNTGWGKGGSGVVVIRYRPIPKGLLLKLR